MTGRGLNNARMRLTILEILQLLAIDRPRRPCQDGIGEQEPCKLHVSQPQTRSIEDLGV